METEYERLQKEMDEKLGEWEKMQDECIKQQRVNPCLLRN